MAYSKYKMKHSATQERDYDDLGLRRPRDSEKKKKKNVSGKVLPCIVASVKWGTPGTDVVHLFYLLACVCCSKSYDLLSCDHARRGVVFVSERFLRKKMERWRPFWRAGVSAARSIEL